MPSAFDLGAIAVLAAGIGAADIARIAQQQGPMAGHSQGTVLLAQAWTPRPHIEDPADRERDRNDAFLHRAAGRERAFQQQQREQAQDRRDLRRMERDRPGWPGR